MLCRRTCSVISVSMPVIVSTKVWLQAEAHVELSCDLKALRSVRESMLARLHEKGSYGDA